MSLPRNTYAHILNANAYSTVHTHTYTHIERADADYSI